MDSVELEKRSELVHNLMVAPQEAKGNYRNAMSVLAGAVNIVTTLVDGKALGFAATSVCSVTDEPPTLLFCINRSASVYDAFAKSDKVCVNTLAADQAQVAQRFGGKTSQQERFAASEWTTLSTGAPVLEGSVVSFDCRVKSRVAVGTHDVVFCRVECVRYGADPDALVYFKRGYHEVR
jgi:flavin reductase